MLRRLLQWFLQRKVQNPTPTEDAKPLFSFWADLPFEIQNEIAQWLDPCSRTALGFTSVNHTKRWPPPWVETNSQSQTITLEDERNIDTKHRKDYLIGRCEQYTFQKRQLSWYLHIHARQMSWSPFIQYSLYANDQHHSIENRLSRFFCGLAATGNYERFWNFEETLPDSLYYYEKHPRVKPRNVSFKPYSPYIALISHLPPFQWPALFSDERGIRFLQWAKDHQWLWIRPFVLNPNFGLHVFQQVHTFIFASNHSNRRNISIRDIVYFLVCERDSQGPLRELYLNFPQYFNGQEIVDSLDQLITKVESSQYPPLEFLFPKLTPSMVLRVLNNIQTVIDLVDDKKKEILVLIGSLLNAITKRAALNNPKEELFYWKRLCDYIVDAKLQFPLIFNEERHPFSFYS